MTIFSTQLSAFLLVVGHVLGEVKQPLVIQHVAWGVRAVFALLQHKFCTILHTYKPFSVWGGNSTFQKLSGLGFGHARGQLRDKGSSSP